MGGEQIDNESMSFIQLVITMKLKNGSCLLRIQNTMMTSAESQAVRYCTPE